MAVPVDSLWLALRLALVLHSRTELYKRATINLSQSESSDFSKTAFKYFICCGTLLQNIFQEHGTFWIYYIGFSSRYISILISTFIVITSARLASLARRQAAQAAFRALVRRNGASTQPTLPLPGQVRQPTLPPTLSRLARRRNLLSPPTLHPPGQAP